MQTPSACRARPLPAAVLRLAAALMASTAVALVGRAGVAPPVEVTKARAAEFAAAFTVVADPVPGRPGAVRVVVAGRAVAGERVTARLTVAGDGGGQQLATALAVSKSGGPAADRDWSAEFEADAATAARCTVGLSVARTQGPPAGTDYRIPVGPFLPAAAPATRPAAGPATRPARLTEAEARAAAARFAPLLGPPDAARAIDVGWAVEYPTPEPSRALLGPGR